MITLTKKPTAPIRDIFQKVDDHAQIMRLEKSTTETIDGRVAGVEQIAKALDEYARLFKAGFGSPAELLTLARAFPDNLDYQSAIQKLDADGVMVVGGPASIEMIDREGHLITTGALNKAFDNYMDNFRTRNAMVLHSDVQVGWALPAYISKGGQIYKSGVNNKGLFFITEVRNDTKISDKVKAQIKEGKLKSYSIAGSATKVQSMQKGLLPYMQVDEMELAEVTVCEKGVNQGAAFDILKAEETAQTGKITKEQCGYRDASNAELAAGIKCGTCVYFNESDGSCDVVVGSIEEDDYCNLYVPNETDADTLETSNDKPTTPVEDSMGMEVHIHLSQDGTPDFVGSFLNLIKTQTTGRYSPRAELAPQAPKMTEFMEFMGSDVAGQNFGGGKAGHWGGGTWRTQSQMESDEHSYPAGGTAWAEDEVAIDPNTGEPYPQPEEEGEGDGGE